MNRTLVLLILGVIVLAMGLLMFSQYSSAPPSPASQSAAPGTAQAPVQEKKPATPSQPAATQESRPQAPSPAALMPAAPVAQAPGQAQGVPPWAAAMPSGPEGAIKPAQPQASVQAPAQTEPSTESAQPVLAGPTGSQGATASVRPASAPSAKVAAQGQKIIHKIVVSSVDNGSAVRIVGVDGMQYKTMHLKNPERVVVDLDGVWAVKAPGVPANKYVSNVRIGKQRNQTRIVIDLRQTPENVRFVKQGTDTLDVRIR